MLIESASFRERLIALRQDLHRHPELAFAEERTAQVLQGELSTLHPLDLRRVAGTGVIARLKGKNSQAPVVAIRGDIDALPIQEDTGLPYASVHPNIMHACGHDVHAAWTVGAAHLLALEPAEGDVVILLQPAEEIGKGAQAILESGALGGVEAIFGAHVDRRYPVGQVVAQEGPLAASADTFDIVVTGIGSHAARPHESADPIVGAAALIGALQTIVSRRINPAEPAVVSIGAIMGGSAPNVIPHSVSIRGTIRAVNEETRMFLQTEIRHIAETTAAAHRLTANVMIENGTPSLENGPEPIAWARAAVASLLGKGALVPLQTPNLAGEDFAIYMQKIPGCFLRIGACEPGGHPIPAHSPQFHAAEESIFVGAAVLAETARRASLALRR